MPFNSGRNGYCRREVQEWLLACRQHFSEQAARLAAELARLKSMNEDLARQVEVVRSQVLVAAAKSGVVAAILQDTDAWSRDLLSEAANRSRSLVTAAQERARGLRAEAACLARECQDYRSRLTALIRLAGHADEPADGLKSGLLQRRVRIIREGDSVILAEEIHLPGQE